jgi:hypothetical protein
MFSEGGKSRLNELMEGNVYPYFIVTIDTFNISLPYNQLYLSLFISLYGHSIFMEIVVGNNMSCTYNILCTSTA